jgi:hypothetical protein
MCVCVCVIEHGCECVRGQFRYNYPPLRGKPCPHGLLNTNLEREISNKGKSNLKQLKWKLT